MAPPVKKEPFCLKYTRKVKVSYIFFVMINIVFT